MTTISRIVPILTTILGIIFIAFTVFLIAGCDEGLQMAGPVIQEPADTEPTTKPTDTPPETTEETPIVVMGEVKTEVPIAESETPTEEPKEPAVDKTPPTVVSVTYYRDAELTEPVTKVTIEDIIFTKVIFSEPMKVKMGVEALPEIHYKVLETETGGGYFVRGSYKMVSHDSELASGEAKPLEDTTSFLCKHEITGNPHTRIFRGVFRITSGKGVDLHGNHIEYFYDEEGLEIESRDIEVLEAYARQLSTLPERTPPIITEFIVPEHLWDEEPKVSPGHFTGRVLVPDPRGSSLRFTAKPTTGATITVMAGPQVGEQVTTNPAGYYYIRTEEEQLHLRVEKEWFEPKEVIVSRSSATILANGDRPNHPKDPQQQPGVILIGQIWPDEMRFLLENMVVVHDLLYIEAGPRDDEGRFIGGGYNNGLVMMYNTEIFHSAPLRNGSLVTRMNIFAEEIIHAHQHAQVARDGSGELPEWVNTPEGQAFLDARERDWQEYGKSGHELGYRIFPAESAAFIGVIVCLRDTWQRITIGGQRDTLIKTPHRQAWAAEWLFRK